ncbi:unnamed protein product, partial [Meganyctiphanes norvegica]
QQITNHVVGVNKLHIQTLYTMSPMSLVSLLCLAALASTMSTGSSTCQKFCPGNGLGQYFCCDEEFGAGANAGSCPRTGATSPELNPSCERDSDCFAWEKCCHDRYTEEKICQFSVFEE